MLAYVVIYSQECYSSSEINLTNIREYNCKSNKNLLLPKVINVNTDKYGVHIVMKCVDINR